MANISNIKTWAGDNREKAYLVGYFVLLLGLSFPVSQMVSRGYEQANIVDSVLRLRLLADITLTQVSVTAFGLFTGLLVLMSIDRKKRVQAVLLWIGVLVSLVVITSQGLGPGASGAAASTPWLAGGLALGLVLGGGQKLLDLSSYRTLEFRRASKGVYFLLVIITVLSYLELHVTYPEIFWVNAQGAGIRTIDSTAIGVATTGIIQDTVTMGLFLVVVRRFIQYDSDSEFFIIGPRASGKSLLLAGAFQEANQRAKSSANSTPLNPSEDLMEMMGEFDRQKSGWMIEATGRGELNNLRFQYVHGSVFPTNITVAGADYAGEYLQRLPDALTGAIDAEDMDTTLERLQEGVRRADTLIIVIDCERFVTDEPLEIAPYFTILQAADDKKALLVATKADYLADEFEEENRLEPHQHYDEFTEFVNQRLRQNQNINGLITQVGGSQIYPVYYQTKTDEQGNVVPMRDNQGNALTVGFDRLLEKIGRM